MTDTPSPGTPSPGTFDSALVRPARPEDAEELLRLRAELHSGLATPEPWHAAFPAAMRERLGTDPGLHAFVSDTGEGRLAACAIGLVYRAYEGPLYTGGLWGRVHSVITDPAHRRRGHAEAVTRALVTALQGAGCASVELNATDDGLPLYEKLGFTPAAHYLTLRRPLDGGAA
ncbi:GNAT family N-acetyltransferase [Kitasatospora sp. NPDC096147]|uniref:GNAT family N-acetyltransferase n=1 Tax=Kitasatospora sp. NPDC096147 TaxID=3364093 RepID=UPI00382DEF24